MGALLYHCTQRLLVLRKLAERYLYSVPDSIMIQETSRYRSLLKRKGIAFKCHGSLKEGSKLYKGSALYTSDASGTRVIEGWSKFAKHFRITRTQTKQCWPDRRPPNPYGFS